MSESQSDKPRQDAPLPECPPAQSTSGRELSPKAAANAHSDVGAGLARSAIAPSKSDDDAWTDHYAGLNPALIQDTADPMTTIDYYGLGQMRAAFHAGIAFARSASAPAQEKK